MSPSDSDGHAPMGQHQTNLDWRPMTLFSSFPFFSSLSPPPLLALKSQAVKSCSPPLRRSPETDEVQNEFVAGVANDYKNDWSRDSYENRFPAVKARLRFRAVRRCAGRPGAEAVEQKLVYSQHKG